jgi:UDP-GlcNAc3NAcA epimerase
LKVMKIVTVVGARPQFIKASMVSRALGDGFEEILVHTGQHYDPNMSGIFFQELELPAPRHQLGVGSASHGRQTGEMLIKLEEVLLTEKPERVLVYGDTNSTLAGALAAAKLHIPVVHVEAGIRSFNREMPEEQNRVLTDHLASSLMCPTRTGVMNLKREGIVTEVFQTGDVMMDSVMHYLKKAEEQVDFPRFLQERNLQAGSYYLLTVHRAENTQHVGTIQVILDAARELPAPVYFPVHPRTRAFVQSILKNPGYQNIIPDEPVGYLKMLMIIKHAKKVLTDSGGLQKEACFMDVPCITLRSETEWPETLERGWNILCGIQKEDILEKVMHTAVQTNNNKKAFGDGNAAVKIVEKLKH